MLSFQIFRLTYIAFVSIYLPSLYNFIQVINFYFCESLFNFLNIKLTVPPAGKNKAKSLAVPVILPSESSVPNSTTNVQTITAPASPQVTLKEADTSTQASIIQKSENQQGTYLHI